MVEFLKPLKVKKSGHSGISLRIVVIDLNGQMYFLVRYKSISRTYKLLLPSQTEQESMFIQLSKIGVELMLNWNIPLANGHTPTYNFHRLKMQKLCRSHIHGYSGERDR